YRGAARFIAAGIEGIESKDVQSAHSNLVRAQAIISELLETLDLERGGELANNLMRIYDYLNHRLVEANLRKDAEPAREVERHLRDLLVAWEQIVRMSAAGRPQVAMAV